MPDETMDGEVLQIIYEEVRDQWIGNYRTFQALIKRLGQIIAFNGVILNLELLGILQIYSANIQVNYLELLTLSSLFISISLLVAIFTYIAAPLRRIKGTDYFNSTIEDKREFLGLVCKEYEEIIEKNKIILVSRTTFTHVSLFTLLIGVLMIASFIILNITTQVNIIIFLLIAALVTLIIYYLVCEDLKRKLNKEKDSERLSED